MAPTGAQGVPSNAIAPFDSNIQMFYALYMFTFSSTAWQVNSQSIWSQIVGGGKMLSLVIILLTHDITMLTSQYRGPPVGHNVTANASITLHF